MDIIYMLDIARSTETNPKRQPVPTFMPHMVFTVGRENFVKWLQNPVYRERAVKGIKQCLTRHLRNEKDHELADILHLGWALSHAWPKNAMAQLEAIGSNNPKAPVASHAFLAGAKRHFNTSELPLDPKGAIPKYALNAPAAAAKEVTYRDSDMVILPISAVSFTISREAAAAMEARLNRCYTITRGGAIIRI